MHEVPQRGRQEPRLCTSLVEHHRDVGNIHGIAHRDDLDKLARERHRRDGRGVAPSATAFLTLLGELAFHPCSEEVNGDIVRMY